ncbi:MAG: hypothetical protein H2172_16385 [Opitutus sp.]|nr:hypothetical protein [Opitutus sp.]MCS6245411.1 hypothetical protein [Opitutus sp.]MCS6274673.1 hypothetical protein [Opitutus sp.]MCS6275899.1 hypothetical protein [Opitutus sp.]MCS6299786.1 hypothetical protein [Opitutus sp.]
MNPAQQSLYFREWGACRKALAELGRAHDDAVRKVLQKEALGGAVKSSKVLTNGELTKVLAKFRTWSEPGNLKAQMHAEEEPEQRIAAYRARVEVLAPLCGIKDGRRGVEGYYWKFLANKKLCQLGADTLRKLVFVMEKRAKELAAKAEAGDDGDPF